MLFMIDRLNYRGPECEQCSYILEKISYKPFKFYSGHPKPKATFPLCAGGFYFIGILSIGIGAS